MLLGREPECERLRRLVEDARRGRSGVLVVRGAAGVGKTALLDYLIQRAQGFQVLHALGLESEQELAYSGLHGLLRPVVDVIGEIPEVQARMLRIALALESGAPDAFVAAAGVLSLLAEAAERQPVLAVVDDAHWLDRASSDALFFAVRRLRAEPVAAVFVVREGEREDLERLGVEELVVGPLEEEAALGLLRERWGTQLAPAVARRLVASTGGNALALVEVAQLLSEEERLGRVPLAAALPVPEAVGRAVRRRLALLDPGAREALLLVAADELAFRLVEQVDLVAGEAAGLLRVRGGQVGFVHPLFRAAVYEAGSDEDRRAAHRQLAAALIEETEQDRRAWHLAAGASGPDETAAAALEAAAERAEARGGSAARADALERAAGLSPDAVDRSRRLRAAANAAFLAGQSERALGLIERVLPDTDDPLQRADLVQQQAAILAWRGPPMSPDLVAREAAQVEPLDPERAVKLLAELEARAIARLDARAFARAADRVEPLLPSLGTWWRPRAAGGVAEGRLWNGEAERARKLFAEMLDDPIAAATQAPALLQLELFDEVRHALTASLELGRQAGQPLRIAWTQACFAELEQASGRTPEAIAAASEAFALAEEMQMASLVAMAARTLAAIAAEQGRAQECRRLAARIDEIGLQLGDDYLRAAARLPLAVLAVGEGRYRDVVALLGDVAERVAAGGIRDPSVMPYQADLIEAYALLGEREAARRELDAFAAQAEATERASALAAAARCEALLAADDDCDHWFEQALVRHEAVPSAFSCARTQLRYGERLRRLRRRRDAREQLRPALASFQALGASLWTQRAEAELKATGETVPRRDRYGPEQLTPQELQIALQVAEGRSNREAAAALFLSPKTVEYHLTHIYRKLELHSRAELVRLFAAESPSLSH